MVHVIKGLADDWRRLDECIEGLSTEIGALACQDPACDRLMTVPGIGPIVSSAMVPRSAMVRHSRRGVTSAPGSDW
jgi:transposase